MKKRCREELFAQTGPDGHGTVVVFDAANRVLSVTRSDATGAAALGMSCVVAAGAGAVVGTGLNNFPRVFDKPKLSDTIGDFMFRVCPSCFSIGL